MKIEIILLVTHGYYCMHKVCHVYMYVLLKSTYTMKYQYLSYQIDESFAPCLQE